MAAPMRQWLLAGGLAATGCALFGTTMLDRFFNRMTFQPTPGEPAAAVAPGVRVNEVTLTTADGLRLHAFYLPRPDSDRAVLMFHGNFGNATQRLPFAARLAELGVSVLVPDYRGYGYSEGTPTEAGLYRDADAAWGYLTGPLGYAPERVVVLGRSLGGAVAIELLTRQAAAGLVLVSTLRSARAMARSMGLGLVAPLAGNRLDSESRIARLELPLLLFHGEDDEIVPVDQGQTLYDLAGDPKTLHRIPGARHNDIVEVADDRFWIPLAAFLDEVAPPADRPDPP
jgi:fermentation-respiration switch protein FrsA (DUF1100 family)